MYSLSLQPWSKRLGTLKKMRHENTPCLLKSYLTCYKCLEILLKEPVSAVPPLPSAMLIVLKKIWSDNVNTKPGGMGGRENASFLPAVALMSQEFWPGLSENPFYRKKSLKS